MSFDHLSISLAVITQYPIQGVVFLWLQLSLSLSLSVQKTMYDTSQVIFSRVPKINTVEIQMPNIHYYVADLSKLQLPNQGDVSITISSPSVISSLGLV